MKWHASFDAHGNQFGFAITTAFLDPSPLPTHRALFACSECGTECPMVIFDATFMFWTATVVAHRDEDAR